MITLSVKNNEKEPLIFKQIATEFGANFISLREKYFYALFKDVDCFWAFKMDSLLLESGWVSVGVCSGPKPFFWEEENYGQ